MPLRIDSESDGIFSDNFISGTELEMEIKCYEEEVQPYWKTDYQSIISDYTHK